MIENSQHNSNKLIVSRHLQVFKQSSQLINVDEAVVIGIELLKQLFQSHAWSLCNIVSDVSQILLLNSLAHRCSFVDLKHDHRNFQVFRVALKHGVTSNSLHWQDVICRGA